MGVTVVIELIVAAVIAYWGHRYRSMDLSTSDPNLRRLDPAKLKSK